jgi:polygalacturonase
VALKSTGPAPCEDVTITNCVLNSHCHGFKMGTESTGGFKRINISNCVVRASNVQHPKMPDIDRVQVITAIALEIVDGGTMEDIQVNNITAEHVFSPIFIKLGNRARKYKEGIEKPEPGKLKDVTISNLTATNAGPFSSSITGFPGHYVKNVSLSNIRISHYGGGKKDEIMEEVPENEKDYPEMKMFGNDWHGPRLPSYGLFIRHVKNITMNNVQITLQNPDAREPIILEDVHGLQADKISQRILPK